LALCRPADPPPTSSSAAAGGAALLRLSDELEESLVMPTHAAASVIARW